MKRDAGFLMYSIVALAILACSESSISVLEPDAAARFKAADSDRKEDAGEAEHEMRGKSLRVLTRNVYVGADVDRVLAAQDPAEIPLLVAQAFQTLLATNFRERAAALANEISETKPHLVGLQEISLIRRQSPGDAVIGGTVPAEDVVSDYLEMLMSALHARNLRYRVAGIIQNADAEVPMLVSANPVAFDDVRLTDFDVVLARRGVKVSNVIATNFAAKLPVPGLGIEIPRGYIALEAKVKGEKYRFVNTHLEPAPIPALEQIQLAQAQELVAMLQHEEKPVVLVGDLNTPAVSGATYQFLTAAGFVDSWTLNSDPAAGTGYTCCHDSDLLNTTVALDSRIDLILVRNGADDEEAIRLREVFATVVGDALADRTPSGLWPSDHAGVFAQLLFSEIEMH